MMRKILLIFASCILLMSIANAQILADVTQKNSLFYPAEDPSYGLAQFEVVIANTYTQDVNVNIGGSLVTPYGNYPIESSGQTIEASSRISMVYSFDPSLIGLGEYSFNLQLNGEYADGSSVPEFASGMMNVNNGFIWPSDAILMSDGSVMDAETAADYFQSGGYPMNTYSVCSEVGERNFAYNSMPVYFWQSTPPMNETSILLDIIRDARNESNVDDFLSATYIPALEENNSEWALQCPPDNILAGMSCGIQNNLSTFISYEPVGDEVENCTNSSAGNFGVSGGIGTLDSVLGNALNDAAIKLQDLADNLSCDGVCTKQTRLKVTDIDYALFGLLGSTFNFDYSIMCSGVVNITGWGVNYNMGGKKTCNQI